MIVAVKEIGIVGPVKDGDSEAQYWRRDPGDGQETEQPGEEIEQGLSGQDAAHGGAEDLYERGEVIRRERPVTPPEVDIRLLAHGGALEGVQVEALVTHGQGILKVEERRVMDDPQHDREDQEDQKFGRVHDGGPGFASGRRRGDVLREFSRIGGSISPYPIRFNDDADKKQYQSFLPPLLAV